MFLVKKFRSGKLNKCVCIVLYQRIVEIYFILFVLFTYRYVECVCVYRDVE